MLFFSNASHPQCKIQHTSQKIIRQTEKIKENTVITRKHSRKAHMDYTATEIYQIMSIFAKCIQTISWSLIGRKAKL